MRWLSSASTGAVVVPQGRHLKPPGLFVKNQPREDSALAAIGDLFIPFNHGKLSKLLAYLSTNYKSDSN